VTKKRSWILGCIAVTLLIAGPMVYRGCGTADRRHAPVPKAGPDRIRTMRPEGRDFSVSIPYFGTVESGKAVSLPALVAGRIVSIHVPDESAVRKGALLFTLGGPKIRARAETLKKRIASLRRRAALADEAVRLKEKAVAEKMARKGELLAAKDARSRIRSDLAAAEAEETALRQQARLRAPIDGVFTNRRVNTGQRVERGAILGRVVPPGALRISATLFPPEGLPLRGLTAIVRTGEGKKITAEVTKVAPVRTREGAVRVRIEGAAVDRSFAPGEGVSGDLLLAVHRNSLSLPRAALVRDEKNQTFVFVKKKDGYHRRAVETGAVDKGRVEIIKGIGENDLVVVRGAYELFYRDFNRTYKVAD